MMNDELLHRLGVLLLTMFIFGLLFGWSIRNAVGQEVIDLHQHAQMGGRSEPVDPYDGIKNFEGLSCCGGYDCRKAINSKDFSPIDGGYLIKPTDEHIPMGWTGFSPDNHWHICRFTSDGGGEKGRRKWKKGDVRCLLVPPGGA